ncbi:MULTISPECIES: nucleotidyltransferase domain-containing protein [Providencia]|jgi:hypothetical protein|uniref:nucleotidyltransferase domain-containing protein n=1 Tax=Providencia TaxID=586 RepID=UPI001C5AE246|nr:MULTISPECIES: nucleotidyltransferase domain-containing protein [Providencia]MDR2225233.1 nucleotidyltransferase domain-containing protein [Providencia sp.]QXX84496.1 nucleotidyltransferase domain-containing protein [Providencia sp. R33]
MLPPSHHSFINHLISIIRHDIRADALLGGGSLVHGGFDEYSDLDFIIVIKDEYYDEIQSDKQKFAKNIGTLLNAFTGHHVGEPRLLICLYGPPLLHVDLKFITLDMLEHRVENPVILFAREENAINAKIASSQPHWPEKSPDWFEERAWIWLHYATVKLARGELYEAIGMISFFREQILGPMLYRCAGMPQREVRRIEQLGLDPEKLLASTLASHNRGSVKSSIKNAITAYVTLRTDLPPSPNAVLSETLLREMLDALE